MFQTIYSKRGRLIKRQTTSVPATNLPTSPRDLQSPTILLNPNLTQTTKEKERKKEKNTSEVLDLENLAWILGNDLPKLKKCNCQVCIANSGYFCSKKFSLPSCNKTHKYINFHWQNSARPEFDPIRCHTKWRTQCPQLGAVTSFCFKIIPQFDAIVQDVGKDLQSKGCDFHLPLPLTEATVRLIAVSWTEKETFVLS